MRKIIVLGAGVIGITTAYYLKQAGYDVTVVDREQSPAAGASFANGGQISVSHAEPWANPGAIKKIFAWLGRDDAPLWFRFRADLAQWLWGVQFLYQCTPFNTRRNIAKIVDLGLHSRNCLLEVVQKHNIEFEAQYKGLLHFYTSSAEFEAAKAPTIQMQKLGCDRKIITTKEVIEIEPALSSISHKILGATYTPTDFSGNARAFTLEMERICSQLGVKFLYGHTVTNILKEKRKVVGLEAITPTGAYTLLEAGSYVLCAGAFSPLLAKNLGINLPIYPAKGYSASIPVADTIYTPKVTMTDDEYKLVFSRQNNIFRVAGTAEFNGYNRELTPARLNAITRRTAELFPQMGMTGAPTFWSGLRPTTPSNVPHIGKTRYHNFYLNTGHGTLGWTMACGSAQRLSQIIVRGR